MCAVSISKKKRSAKKKKVEIFKNVSIKKLKKKKKSRIKTFSNTLLNQIKFCSNLTDFKAIVLLRRKSEKTRPPNSTFYFSTDYSIFSLEKKKSENVLSM